jgi:RsiW-degrading membrane proteinase PrsW (M82 family)
VPEAPVFFAFTGGKQVGPLSKDELTQMVRGGLLMPKDLVWESGTPDWVAADTLVPLLPPNIEPIPPPMAPPPVPPPEPAPAPAAWAGAAAQAVSRGAVDTGGRIRRLVDDIGSFSFAEMVPLSRLWDPETLGRPISWILLGFGLGPLIIGTLIENPALKVRLFNFACGALWTAFFAAAFRTGKQSVRLGVAAFFGTGIFGILFVSVLQQVPPISWLYGLLEPSHTFLLRLVAFVAGVGVLEEVGKGLVLLFLAKKLGGLADAADGVFYGLMSGLGFGVYEAIQYTESTNVRHAAALSYITGSESLGLYSYFVSSFVRIVSLPLLHAVWTAIAGYFIGLSFLAKKKTHAVLAVGFLVPIVLHGLYDALLSANQGLLAIVVATVTLLLFLAYRRSADRVAAEIERADRQ